MTATASTAATELTVSWIPLDHIHEAPWNPRKHFDAKKLEEMAESIRQKGVLEPAIVRLRPKAGGYELVAGARRFRASRLAGAAKLPAIVRDLDDAAALEFAVIENGQREDVSPIEEAEGFKALQAIDPTRFTVAEIAAKCGKAESYVYRRLKLLSLEEKYREALAEGRLTIAHAEALCRLTPAQRKDADGRSLIWRNLFDGSRTANDLAPLNELLNFIREKTHFDPAAEDTRHFQPELAVDLDAIAEEEGTEPEQLASALVELSTDSLVRMKLGAKEGASIPLSPSKWREINGAKDRCEFAQRGVITHGSAARVIEVCTKKSCTKHFPPAKKAKASRSASAPATSNKAAIDARKKREQAQRTAEAAEWNALVKVLRPAVVEHFKHTKLTPELFLTSVRDASGNPDLHLKDFGVTPTATNLGLCAALLCIELEEADAEPNEYTWRNGKQCRTRFLASVKPLKFNMGSVEQRFKAEQKKQAASAKKGKA